MKRKIAHKALVATALVTAVFIGGRVAIASPGEPPGGRERAARTVLSCDKLKKTEVAQTNAGQSTTSSTFVDVTDSTVSFNVGGNNPSCVTVSFSAQVFAPNGRVMFVQALLDNVVSADGSILFVSQSDTNSDAHAYNFLFPDVQPGLHTFKMQYRSQTNGQTVFINDFNLNIQHR
jgi:hypothetical protein